MFSLLPIVDLLQFHPPLALHDVAFDTVQARVVGVPLYPDVNDVVNVTLGATGFATFTVTLCDVEPPGPVQLRVYVLELVRLLSEMDLLAVR